VRYFDRGISFDAALRDLEHADARVRLQAADALGHVSEEQAPRARQALRPLLRDDRPDVRYTAALSLGELKDREALEALVEQMEGDGHPMPRQAATIALGMLADPRAVPALLRALKSGPPDARFQAATSLAQVDPAAAQEPLRRALADDDREGRASAASALGDLGDRSAASALRPLLDDPFPAVQLEAAVALARLGDRGGSAVLAVQLGESESALIAAEHLFRCPDPSAAPALRRALGRWLTPPLVKVWAAAALARLGEEEGKRHLLRQLGARRQTARGLAIQVLGELGEPWARQALEELAASPAGQGWQEEISAALGAPRA